jgi:hypothetical protein
MPSHVPSFYLRVDRTRRLIYSAWRHVRLSHTHIHVSVQTTLSSCFCVIFSLQTVSTHCLWSFLLLITVFDSRKRSSTSMFRPKCRYCHCLGHTIVQCRKLQGRSSCPLIAISDAIRTTDSPKVSTLTYEDFLRWVKFRQSFAISGAHTGKSFSCNSTSPYRSPWVLDSGATHHITVEAKSLN